MAPASDMTRKSFTYIGVAVLGMALLAAAAWYWNRPVSAGLRTPSSDVSAAAPSAPSPGGQQGSPVSVEVVRLVRTTLTDEVAAVGTVRSNESVVLRPEVAGRIETINFREGQAVRKGQVLVALDASVNLAEVAQTHAQLDLAKRNLDRTEELARRNFVSASARDEAASKSRVAEAALQLASARLSKMRIVAPFGGVAGIRNVSVGDYVKDGADLINIEDIRSVKIDFRLPERYQPQLRVGQRLEMTTDALPGRRFEASVDAIDPLLDANGRSVSIRARAANTDGALRPGMFARVRLIFTERSGAVVVPEEAIVPLGGEYYVYRVVDGAAQRSKVKIGARRDAKVEIVEGAGEGDVVVVAGQLKLVRDAMPVRVVAAPEAGRDSRTPNADDSKPRSAS